MSECNVKPETIGERVHLLRRRQGLSLRQVALRAGVSAATVCRIEADRSAEFWHVARVAQALGIGLDALTDGLRPDSRDTAGKRLMSTRFMTVVSADGAETFVLTRQAEDEHDRLLMDMEDGDRRVLDGREARVTLVRSRRHYTRIVALRPRWLASQMRQRALTGCCLGIAAGSLAMAFLACIPGPWSSVLSTLVLSLPIAWALWWQPPRTIPENNPCVDHILTLDGLQSD